MEGWRSEENMYKIIRAVITQQERSDGPFPYESFAEKSRVRVRMWVVLLRPLRLRRTPSSAVTTVATAVPRLLQSEQRATTGTVHRIQPRREPSKGPERSVSTELHHPSYPPTETAVAGCRHSSGQPPPRHAQSCQAALSTLRSRQSPELERGRSDAGLDNVRGSSAVTPPHNSSIDGLRPAPLPISSERWVRASGPSEMEDQTAPVEPPSWRN